MKYKPMSDDEVNDHVSKMLTDDLDGIEAHGMFDEANPMTDPHAGVKMEAGGMSIHVKPMDGEQVGDMPKVMKANSAEEDENPEFEL